MAYGMNKLTDKKLKALLGVRSERETKLADGAGLMIRVTKTGAISWFYKYRLGGRDTAAIIATLGRYPDLTLAKAREMRDQCRTWLAAGRDPQRMLKLGREASLAPVTVKDALEYWLTEHVDGNLVNDVCYRQRFINHIYPYIGDMALSDCETHHWLTCLTRTKKKAPSTAGIILQMAQQAFKFCRIRRYAVTGVLDGLTMQDIGVKTSKRKRVLTNREFADLLTALNGGYFSPYYTNLLTLLISFGARTGEVRLSELNEWDLKDKLWTVPESHSKNGDKIVRPIPDSLCPMIEQLKKQNKKSGLLLGEIKTDSAVSQTGRKINLRLGHTEHWRLHDLRRTFSTGMSDIGVAPHIVELLLGHTLGGVMAVYNRSQYLPEKLDALNRWVERLELISGNHESSVFPFVSGKA